MENLEKYLTHTSDLIEEGIINPIEILNRLYKDFFKTTRKRKPLSLLEHKSVTREDEHKSVTREDVCIKFLTVLSDKNKTGMIDMFSVFLLFYPHLCDWVPKQLQPALKRFQTKDLILNTINDLNEKLLRIALDGRLDGLQDFIQSKEDKGENLIKELCHVIINVDDAQAVSQAILSLSVAGNILTCLPKYVQILVLNTLFDEYQVGNSDTLAEAADALVLLIPQLDLPQKIQQMTEKIQADFTSDNWYQWRFSAKILNAIDRVYLINAKMRHDIVERLMSFWSNVPYRYDAMRAFGKLKFTLTLEPDGGICVVNRLLSALESESIIERRTAFSVLHQLTHIIEKYPDIDSVFTSFAKHITSLSHISSIDINIKNWEPMLINHKEGGLAFFERLTQAILKGHADNAIVIIQHLIHFQNAIVALPDKGFKLLSACLKLLVTKHNACIAMNSSGSPQIMRLIETLGNLKYIFKNSSWLLNEAVLLFIHIRSLDSSYNHAVFSALSDLSELFHMLEYSTQNSIKLIEPQIETFIEESKHPFNLPKNVNKKSFLYAHNHSITNRKSIQVADFLCDIFQSLSSNHLKQLSWTWIVLQFFKNNPTHQVYGFGKALGQFYVTFFQREALLTHIPVKDVTCIVQAYARS